MERGEGGGYYGVKVTEHTRNFFLGGGGGWKSCLGIGKIGKCITIIYTFFWQLDLSRNSVKGCSKQSGAYNAGLAVQTAR